MIMRYFNSPKFAKTYFYYPLYSSAPHKNQNHLQTVSSINQYEHAEQDLKKNTISILSKPKLNQQLSSKEFEVRLHSYPEVHQPPPQTVHVVVVFNSPASRQGPVCTTV